MYIPEYIYSERPKMDWKLPGYAKDMEQHIDVIHTTVFMQRWRKGAG
jgi:hypothetical protein